MAENQQPFSKCKKNHIIVIFLQQFIGILKVKEIIVKSTITWASRMGEVTNLASGGVRLLQQFIGILKVKEIIVKSTITWASQMGEVTNLASGGVRLLQQFIGILKVKGINNSDFLKLTAMSIAESQPSVPVRLIGWA